MASRKKTDCYEILEVSPRVRGCVITKKSLFASRCGGVLS